AKSASDALKDDPASPGARAWTGIGRWPVREAHHHLELYPIRQDVERIVKRLVFGVITRGAHDIGRDRFVGALAPRVLFGCGWKSFVSDPHLDIVGLAAKMVIDLFWAFQPKRVMVSSLPLRFG